MSSDRAAVNLLMLIHDLAPFGAQRVALNILKYSDPGKLRVTVCSFGKDNALAAEFRAAGAEVIELEASRYLDLKAWTCFFGVVSVLRPDIIQTNLAELSVPLRLLRIFLHGARIVHTVQNPLSSEPWYWRLLNRATLFLCAGTVFCSEGIKAEAGLSGKKLSVIQNGIRQLPAAAGRPLRRELGIGEDAKVVCCVARLARQKGQDILIRALAMLAAEYPELCLLLAGDGEDRGMLESLAAAEGVGAKVFFLGRRADVAEILASSDIYAAPSRWEGFGLSLGEAMLSGIPCVATLIPGHTDMLRDGITGVAVPAENPAGMAAGIRRLIVDAAAAREISRAASGFISLNFNVKDMALRYQELYSALGGNRKGIV